MAIPKDEEQLRIVKARAKAMSTKAGIKSAFLGALPLPFIDAAIDIAILSRLLERINEEFGLSQEQLSTYDEKLRIALIDISKRSGAHFIGKLVTRNILLPAIRRLGSRIVAKQTSKYLPVVGTAVSATISFSSMKLLSHMHIKECEAVVRNYWKSAV